MKMKISISRMCSLLQEHHYENVEPGTPSDISSKRIRELAFAKRRQQESDGNTNKQDKEKHMKTSLRVLLIAAVICTLSLTAFAAFGGLEFFKSIFGDSAQSIGEHIQNPMTSTENEDYRLTVESLLSDGFKTDLIVSLAAKNGKPIPFDPMEMFHTQFIGNEEAMNSASYREMPEFAQGDTQYYHLELTSLGNHNSAEVKISLKEELAPLSVTVPVNGTMARKEIHIKAEDYADQNYYPETVQLSPMGMLVIGSEKHPKGGLPTAQMFVQMKDGTHEELMSEMSFDDGEETVGGGGGAVIVGPGETAPLVITTMGSRNPDNKVVTSGSFSRILNLDQVQAIIVDDVEYTLQ